MGQWKQHFSLYPPTYKVLLFIAWLVFLWLTGGKQDVTRWQLAALINAVDQDGVEPDPAPETPVDLNDPEIQRQVAEQAALYREHHKR